jgi:hypothetical protein
MESLANQALAELETLCYDKECRNYIKINNFINYLFLYVMLVKHLYKDENT